MRRLLFVVVALASCSKGPEADLASIGQARSLAAEWALVNEQAQQGHLTSTFARTMRKNVRQQLQMTAKSLTEPNSAYGRQIDALKSEPEDAPPEQLRAHAKILKQIEHSLESA